MRGTLKIKHERLNFSSLSTSKGTKETNGLTLKREHEKVTQIARITQIEESQAILDAATLVLLLRTQISRIARIGSRYYRFVYLVIFDVKH